MMLASEPKSWAGSLVIYFLFSNGRGDYQRAGEGSARGPGGCFCFGQGLITKVCRVVTARVSHKARNPRKNKVA